MLVENQIESDTKNRIGEEKLKEVFLEPARAALDRDQMTRGAKTQESRLRSVGQSVLREEVANDQCAGSDSEGPFAIIDLMQVKYREWPLETSRIQYFRSVRK